MSQIDVYGIGNALVDTEFEVEDSFFEEAGIQKGFMTLIEEDQQKNILNILSSRYPVKKKAGGGSAANTLYAISQFGGHAFYACRVAGDTTGDFYLSELGDHNIRTNQTDSKPVGNTGQCLVMVSPDAERTMLTHLGVSSDVSVADLDLDIATTAKYVYMEGYLVSSDSARQAVLTLKQAARDAGIPVAFTFSDPAMVEYFKDGVKEVMEGGVDLLFCNEQEACIWAETDDFATACETLKQSATQFVITRGAKGALLYNGQSFIEIAGNKVTAVDTNGAGDMFAGAFLYGLSQGMGFEKSGKLASLASAKVVTSFGPRLTPAEHLALLAEF